MFVFLYVRKSLKKYQFLLRFKANYLKRKIARLPQFFFVDSNSPCKDILFPRGPNMAQKPSVVGRGVNEYHFFL